MVAAAAYAASASAASAADVWLWACHGPNGQGIASDFTTQTSNGQADQKCGGGDPSLTLSVTAAAGSSARAAFSVPALDVKMVRVVSVKQAAGTPGHDVLFNGTRLDGVKVADGGQTETLEYAIANPASGPLTLRLECGACDAPASAEIVSIAFLVADDRAPSGNAAFSPSNPVNAGMNVNALARDSGAGLDHIVATVDARPVLPAGASARRTVTVPIGRCGELSPGNATIDRALDPASCLGALAATDPPPIQDPPAFHVATSDLGLQTAAAQPFYRTVTLYDVAGNATVLVGQRNGDGSVTGARFDIWHPPLGSKTATLTIGTAPIAIPAPGANPPRPGKGGVVGRSRASCRAPRLSVMLRTKPLRVRKGVPVLRYKKKYLFTGRLTCVIRGKRKSAPKRTRIAIYNKVRKRTVRKGRTLIRTRTVRKGRTLIRSKGRLRVRLRFPSSRKVIFRYTNSDRQRAQVTIKVRVKKKATRARR